MSAPQHVGDFYRRPLRRPGVERAIVAKQWANGDRLVEFQLIEDGRTRGLSQLRAENVDLVQRAIDRTRESKKASECVGSFRDGRFDVEVRVGPHPEGGAAIFLHRRDDSGADAGRPVALYGDEIQAIEAGLAWLVEGSGS